MAHLIFVCKYRKKLLKSIFKCKGNIGDGTYEFFTDSRLIASKISILLAGIGLNTPTLP